MNSGPVNDRPADDRPADDRLDGRLDGRPVNDRPAKGQPVPGRHGIPQSPAAPERMAGMVPGVRAGGFLFLSAIRGRDPVTHRMPDDPYEQACQALRNLEAVLAGSGASLRHVVKVTLYLHDLDTRQAFHRAWMEFFPEDPPARIAVGVADANAAPGGNAHYALDVIALAP